MSVQNVQAVIGKSIVVKGELSGQEDLVVEGTLEGQVNLVETNLFVGETGRVKANVFARTVTITGQVEGDVSATERIEITASGSVKGNIQAPRLVVADGAYLKGSVDMQKPSTEGKVKGPINADRINKPVVEVV